MLGEQDAVSPTKIYLRVRDRFDWSEIDWPESVNEFTAADSRSVVHDLIRIQKRLSETELTYSAITPINRIKAKSIVQDVGNLLSSATSTIRECEARKPRIDSNKIDELMKRWLKDYILWRISTRFGCWQKEDVPEQLIDMILRPAMNSNFFHTMKENVISYAKQKNGSNNQYLINTTAWRMGAIFNRDGYAIIESLIGGAKYLLYKGITVAP